MEKGPSKYQQSDFVCISYDSSIPLTMNPLLSPTNPKLFDPQRLVIHRAENSHTRSVLGQIELPLSGGYLLSAITSSTSSDIEHFILTLYPQLDYTIKEEPLREFVKNSSPDSLIRLHNLILNNLPNCTIISDEGIILERSFLGPGDSRDVHSIFRLSGKDNWWIAPDLTRDEKVKTDGTWQGLPLLPYRLKLDGPYLFEYILKDTPLPIGNRLVSLDLNVGIELACSDFTEIVAIIKGVIQSGTPRASEFAKAARFYCG